MCCQLFFNGIEIFLCTQKDEKVNIKIKQKVDRKSTYQENWEEAPPHILSLICITSLDPLGKSTASSVRSARVQTLAWQLLSCGTMGMCLTSPSLRCLIIKVCRLHGVGERIFTDTAHEVLGTRPGSQ